MVSSGGFAALSILVFALFASVGLAIVFVFSVTRQVALHKHGDWKFGDAVGFVALRGAAALAVFALAMTAIWIGPGTMALPYSPDEIRFGQIALTAVLAIGMNVHWYGYVLSRISRPPTQ